jgi:hypothetical protein
LVHIKFDLEHRHGLLELGVVTACAVHGFRNVLENKVEVDLVFLCGLTGSDGSRAQPRLKGTFSPLM